ncbi:MAG: acyltransferase [Cyclobacteriaceae bacterium]
MQNITGYLEKIQGKIAVWVLRSRGSLLKGKLGLRRGVDIPRLPHKIRFGNRVNLDRGVSIILSDTPDNKNQVFLLTLGDHVYINRYTVIDATTEITIGDRTMIGTHCYITDHDHDFKGAPVDQSIGELPIAGKPTIIGQNVWIGSHVTILKGVTIGDNCIIGAGSVVTKSIPENMIAVGNPCKVLKERK